MHTHYEVVIWLAMWNIKWRISLIQLIGEEDIKVKKKRTLGVEKLKYDRKGELKG